MRAALIKEFKFEAAHRLPHHDGACARPHGHSYRVVVHIEGEIKPTDGSPEEGMVLNFGKIEKAWQDIEHLLDHQDLNITLGPDIGATTVENIASWIMGALQDWLEDLLTAVTVYDTATSSATVRA